MNVQRNAIASHVGKNLGPDRGEILADIAHRDRITSRGSKAARCYDTNRVAGGIDQDRIGAHRLTAIGPEAHALAPGALGHLVEKRRGANETGLFADRLGNRPGQTGIDRIDLRSDIMSMQAQPGFQPQTVARRKPNPLHPFVGKKRGDEFPRRIRWQADFETVLAGIARAAHEPARFRLEAVHEGKLCTGNSGHAQHIRRLGPLDRQECAIKRIDPAVKALRNLTQMRLVCRRIPGIGDNHEVVSAQPRDDQVIENPGLLVEEERVFGLSGLEGTRIERTGAGKQCHGIGSGQIKQLHVRDVEQPCLLPRVQMLLHHPQRIGDRHGPSREPAKARIGSFVHILERQ